jgi:putative transposase
MTHEPGHGRSPDRWAHLRFSVIGPLLAAPPPPGAPKAALTALAATPWQHPLIGEPTRFAFSTIERWLYRAKRERTDPVGVLRRKVRKDLGQSRVFRAPLTRVLLAQYQEHPGWSAQLHADNLAVRVEEDPGLGPMPSYSTIRRVLRAHGLVRRWRLGPRGAPGAARAEARFERREVRSYEAAHVHGLWHLDFHHGSRQVLRPDGTRVPPFCSACSTTAPTSAATPSGTWPTPPKAWCREPRPIPPGWSAQAQGASVKAAFAAHEKSEA